MNNSAENTPFVNETRDNLEGMPQPTLTQGRAAPAPWPNTFYPVSPIGPEKKDACPCSGGESGTGGTDNNSVDFTIEFGRFPKWGELAPGRLLLNINMMDASLCWGMAFQYQHLTQRRLDVAEAFAGVPTATQAEDVSQAVIKTEKGFPRFYSFATNVSGSEAGVCGGMQPFQERMRRVTVNGKSYLEEEQGDGTVIRFRPGNTDFDHLVTPHGVTVTKARLDGELQVVRTSINDLPSTSVQSFNAFDYNSIIQIWNRADGLLDLSNPGAIKWYAPGDVSGRKANGEYTLRDGATPIKTWSLSWTYKNEATRIVNGMDDQNPDVYLQLLDTLRIEEPGGFISEWRAGLYPDDLTLVKGTGDDAISIVTQSRPAPGHANIAAKWPNGQAMAAGGYYTDKVEKYKYVYSGVAGTPGAILCSSSREVFERRAFGDVLVSRTEGYGTALAQTWTYGYESNPSSSDYGRVTVEQGPDGSRVDMHYDTRGRITERLEPWYGDIRMKTVCEYNTGTFNDHRIKQKTVYLVSGDGGSIQEIHKDRYDYNNDGQYSVRGIMVNDTGLDDVAYIDHSWHADTHPCIYARGRLNWKRDGIGTETFCEYADTTAYGAAWSCTETVGFSYGVIVPGQSTRIIRHYAENGDEVATEQQVHVEGEGFVTIHLQRMTYDPSHRVIRTDYANGLYSTAEWSCAGPLWETDVRGLQTRYFYDGAKRLVRVEQDAAAPVQSWNGEDMTAICPDTVTQTTYDGAGRALAVTTATGTRITSTSTTYDILGRVSAYIDELGRTTRYTYSSDGLTTTETTPANATQITTKHPSGLVTAKTGSGQTERFYSYGFAQNGVLKREHITGPAGPVVEERRETGRGLLLAVSRPSPTTPSFMATHRQIAYNLAGRPVSEQENDTAPMLYEYHHLGDRLSATRQGYGAASDIKDGKYEFGFRFCRLPAEIAMQFYSSNINTEQIYLETVVTAYDARLNSIAQLQYELVSRMASTAPETEKLILKQNAYGNWSIAKTINDHGNKRNITFISGYAVEEEEIILNGDTVRFTDMQGITTRYKRTFNAAGDTLTVRDPRGNDTVIIHDLAGRETCRTDTAGQTTLTTYDTATGNPACITMPDGTQTRQTHDCRGRLTQRYGTATQPMQWEYDDRDRITALHTWRNPEAPLNTIPTFGSDVTRWAYDPVTGALLHQTYPDETRTTYQYDDWCRPVKRTQAGGSPLSYRYDIRSGKMDLISSGTEYISAIYDSLGRVEWIGDNMVSTSYSYTGFADVTSERVTYSSPDAEEIRFDFTRDSHGDITGYSMNIAGSVVQQVELGYDMLHRLNSAAINGRTFSYGYDNTTGWPIYLMHPTYITSQQIFHPTLPLVRELTIDRAMSAQPALLRHVYGWDAMQRPSFREDYQDNQTEPARRQEYAYNTRGELASVQISPGNPGGDCLYQYDNIGNRITAGEQGDGIAYQTNGLNQYTAITRNGHLQEPEWDLDGNQTLIHTSTGAWNVRYNAFNRPVSFSQGNKRVECTYDHMGRRVEKVEYDGNTLTRRTWFVYMGYLMAASIDGTQEGQTPWLLNTWFWDPSEPQATRLLAVCAHDQYKTVTSTRYVTHDLLKSVSALFDENGNRVARFEYSPYGETLIAEGPEAEGMPFRYSCEYHDDDLGLIYYNYRHYNPRDGRWITRDPIGESGGELLYGFVGNQVSWAMDILGLKQLYQSLEEAKMAGVRAVMDAMNESYQKLIDSGFDPTPPKDFKDRKSETQKRKERKQILRKLHETEPELAQEIAADRKIEFRKWEYGVRICCTPEGKYYVGQVKTLYRPTEMSLIAVPPCDQQDHIVAHIHTHTGHNPAFSTIDDRTKKNGVFHANPRVAVPNTAIMMTTVETEKGETLAYEYNPATKKTGAYLNYHRIR